MISKSLLDSLILPTSTWKTTSSRPSWYLQLRFLFLHHILGLHLLDPPVSSCLRSPAHFLLQPHPQQKVKNRGSAKLMPPVSTFQSICPSPLPPSHFPHYQHGPVPVDSSHPSLFPDPSLWLREPSRSEIFLFCILSPPCSLLIVTISIQTCCYFSFLENYKASPDLTLTLVLLHFSLPLVSQTP